MREDPQDRFVRYRLDARLETYIAVLSLRAVGVSSIKDYVNARWAADFSSDEFMDISTLASIGSPTVRDRYGRVCPEEIKQLLDEAEARAANRRLSCGPFADYFVLPCHRDAEQGTGFE